MLPAASALVLLLPVTSGWANLLPTRPASPASASIAFHAASLRLALHAASPLPPLPTHPAVAAPEKYAGTIGGPTEPHILQTVDTGLLVDSDLANWSTRTTASKDRWVPCVTRKDKEMPYGELSQKIAHVSRRDLLRGALWTTGMYCGSGTIACASAYTVQKVEPDEKETYAEAQKGKGPLRVLWVGSGDMKSVFKSLFSAGNEVIALDLLRPNAKDLSAATTYATEHGYQLRFEQGDATNLKFTDGTFDVVVSSMFLCQDFNPEIVVSEIRRVLKPGGRFGFYEHIEDIDKVIVDKVFGERSVIRVQHAPELFNVMAGVVKKV
mmetsp:Transcript_24507/g.37942  ORF Transcript_24507/g.37942 Transcript_24507/m.37942 type:complete len:324 (-) Transcript_24507:140-1111(-)|eukprot:CAMPEP_0194276602 /NCGR_PEP_ID=MMETSP0169-20130528/9147_1 /TAXON_ID=218684 /ORGANISM="Corethron pennatum, Strain L29A3" /LENGTH=323 /DNA_ID=CAMNT_0039020351 /DNA_START=115 /DNA_END=1086 /DNA_ORIENTATION=+